MYFRITLGLTNLHMYLLLDVVIVVFSNVGPKSQFGGSLRLPNHDLSACSPTDFAVCSPIDFAACSPPQQDDRS